MNPHEKRGGYFEKMSKNINEKSRKDETVIKRQSSQSFRLEFIVTFFPLIYR